MSDARPIERCRVCGLFHKNDDYEKRVRVTMCRCGNEIIVHGGPAEFDGIVVGQCATRVVPRHATL